MANAQQYLKTPLCCGIQNTLNQLSSFIASLIASVAIVGISEQTVWLFTKWKDELQGGERKTVEEALSNEEWGEGEEASWNGWRKGVIGVSCPKRVATRMKDDGQKRGTNHQETQWPWVKEDSRQSWRSKSCGSVFRLWPGWMESGKWNEFIGGTVWNEKRSTRKECGRPKGNSVQTRAGDCISRGMLRLELPVRRSGVCWCERRDCRGSERRSVCVATLVRNKLKGLQMEYIYI